MKAVYITYPWFLDFSIEYIKELSKSVNLEVIIVCPLNKLNSTILSINKESAKLNEFKNLDEIGEQNIEFFDIFKSYTKNCLSFRFFFISEDWKSISTIKGNYKLAKSINNIKPDLIHFDDISIDLYVLKFLLNCKNILLNVHDPKPHLGEVNMRRKIIRKIYFSSVKTFIVFSQNAEVLFKKANKGIQPLVLSLTPYYFYSEILKCSKHNEIKDTNYMLFIGRVSPYKGIEVLINAFNEYTLNRGKLKLVIAGKSVPGYNLPDLVNESQNFNIINSFISNTNLVNLINHAEFVVCPYLEATQSGVLMTCFALKKKVLVSNVEGLIEYMNTSTGLVFNIKSKKDLIDKFDEIQDLENLKSTEFKINSENNINYTCAKLLETYKNIL